MSTSISFTCRAASATNARTRVRPVEPPPQVVETWGVFSRSILVWRAFSLTGTLLSMRIYKIYTPLSTGFVENIRRLRPTAARKPLRDAAFRGARCSP